MIMTEMRSDCCWCGKDTSNKPVVTLSAKFNEKGKTLEKKDGYIKELPLLSNENVWVIIVGDDSPAKKQGSDMLFMCCSRKCALELREALESEKDFLDSINLI